VRLLKHVLIASASAILFSLFFQYNLIYSVVAAIAGSLILDIMDHGFNFAFARTKFAKHARSILTKQGIIEAYRYYYINRKKEIRIMMLHNPFSYTIIFLISVITTMIYTNYAVYSFFILGIVLHQLADLYEDIILGENIPFWTDMNRWNRLWRK
jgi:hypothetical protein